MLELAPISEKYMTYDDAVLYCQFLDYNGHRDWRMPTSEERHDNKVISGWSVNSRKFVFSMRVTPVRDVC